MSDVSIDVRDDHVAVVEFSRPPHNHFDAQLIGALADASKQVTAMAQEQLGPLAGGMGGALGV